MAIEQRKGSKWWYARLHVNGRRVCVRLDVERVGQPGERAYDDSRAKAKKAETALRAPAATRDAATYRRLADALDGLAAEARGRRSAKLADLPARWAASHAVAPRWKAVCKARLAAFASAMAARGAATEEEVTPALARAYMAAQAAALAPETYNAVLILLRGALPGPFAGIPRRKRAMAHKVPMTAAEIEKLLAACPPEIRGAVATAAYTGLRRGDACRLSWADIDLAGGWIRTKTAKTGEAVSIPILPALRAILPANPGTGPVWPEAAALHRRNPNGLTARMADALEAADLAAEASHAGTRKRKANARGWHSLKTSFVTAALNGGIPMEQLRVIVGNNAVDVVRDHYYRPDADAIKAGLEKALAGWGKV